MLKIAMDEDLEKLEKDMSCAFGTWNAKQGNSK